MKLLKEVAKQFSVSKPVFEAHFKEGELYVEFHLKEIYRPVASNYPDPVAQLLANNFSEVYDKDLGRFEHYFNYQHIYADIMKKIKLFFIEHTDLKNPKQSRLYKWLDSLYTNQMNHAAAEGFIALYRYIHRDGGIGVNDTNVANVLAILELMREKYEVKQETN